MRKIPKVLPVHYRQNQGKFCKRGRPPAAGARDTERELPAIVRIL